jgi:hypothetical protein
MSDEVTEDQDPDAEFSGRVVQQIFEIFLEPELARRGGMSRSDVRQALVILPSDGQVQVQLNDEAALVGTVQVTGPVESGQTIDITEVSELRPEADPGDSGWVAYLAVEAGTAIVAFDFRRNKDRARKLLDLAEQYFSTAEDARGKLREAVAVDALHTTAELCVTALMNLTMEHRTNVRRRSGLHSARTGWLDRYADLGNLPTAHSYALRRLSNLRPSARYGEPPLTLKDGELQQLAATVAELMEATRRRVGDPLPPVPGVPNSAETQE